MGSGKTGSHIGRLYIMQKILVNGHILALFYKALNIASAGENSACNSPCRGLAGLLPEPGRGPRFGLIRQGSKAMFLHGSCNFKTSPPL